MPQEAKFKLNAKNYVAMRPKEKRGGLTIERDYLQTQLDSFAPQFTTTGGQQQDALQGATPKVFGSMINGFGLSRIPADQANNPDFYKRFWDSNMETRFSSGIRQAILAEDATHSGLEQSVAGVNFKGGLGSIWADATNSDILYREFDGTDWAAIGTVMNVASSVVVPVDLITHKNVLIALVVGGSGAAGDDHLTFFDNDGAGTWTTTTTQPAAGTLNGDVSAGDSKRYGMLVDLGDEAALAQWQEDNTRIFFASTSDSGANWAGEGISIDSADGPLGVAVYPGIDDADKLYVLTVEGLWEVDFAPSTWTVQRVPGAGEIISVNSTGGALAVGPDGLWIAQGVSDDAPARVFRMTVSNGTRDFALVPNDLSIDDGVPSDMLGPVRAMILSDGFVYASLGGGKASRKARVLCHNGRGWHHMFQVGTENQKIDWLVASPNIGNIERLHFGIRTGSTTTDAQFLTHPNVNPESLTGTIKRTQSTTLDLPFFDGGMPTTLATWLQTQLSATSLTDASNEFVNVDYATDGTRGSFTDLGNFLSALTNLDWPSGATAGRGVSNRFVALRINMERASGTPTNDPIIHFITQMFLQTPPILLAYEFIVDLEASGRLTGDEGHGSVTAVKTALDAAAAPGVLVELVSAQLGTKYVQAKVNYVHAIKNDQFQGPGDTLAQAPAGYAIVVLEEQV